MTDGVLTIKDEQEAEKEKRPELIKQETSKGSFNRTLVQSVLIRGAPQKVT